MSDQTGVINIDCLVPVLPVHFGVCACKSTDMYATFVSDVECQTISVLYVSTLRWPNWLTSDFHTNSQFRRVDKNFYKSINLSRTAFDFVCEFKIPSEVACPHYIYFTILNSEFCV